MAQYLSYNGSRIKKISYGGSTFRYVNFVSSNSTTTYKLATDAYTASAFVRSSSKYSQAQSGTGTAGRFTASYTSKTTYSGISNSTKGTASFYFYAGTTESFIGYSTNYSNTAQSLMTKKSSNNVTHELTVSRAASTTASVSSYKYTNYGTYSALSYNGNEPITFSFTVPDGTNITHSSQLINYTNITQQSVSGTLTTRYSITSNPTASITKVEI